MPLKPCWERFHPDPEKQLQPHQKTQLQQQAAVPILLAGWRPVCLWLPHLTCLGLVLNPLAHRRCTCSNPHATFIVPSHLLQKASCIPTCLHSQHTARIATNQASDHSAPESQKLPYRKHSQPFILAFASHHPIIVISPSLSSSLACHIPSIITHITHLLSV